MNRTEMLTELREVLDDASTSFTSWSDSRLLAYLSEGQDKFCEDTGFFRDASSYTIVLVAGTASYSIPARAIQLLDIYDGTTKLGKIYTGSELDGVIQSDLSTAQPGRPTQWKTDLTTGSILLRPTPSTAEAGVILSLRVWRYSLYDLAGVALLGAPATPEIPTRVQRACVEWAAYKAFSHHDAETQDPIKARDHKENYKEYVADGRRMFDRMHNIETRLVPNPTYVA